VEGVGEFGGRMLRRSFQPLDAFLWSLGQSQFSVQFRNAQSVLCTWVESSTSLPKELHSLRGLPPATPAVLTACTGTIRSIRMTVLGSKYEEGEGTIEVLLGLCSADPVGVTIGKEVLGWHVSPVRKFSQQGCGFAVEIVPFVLSLLDFDDVHARWFRGRDGPMLGGVDQEDGEFKLKLWVLCLLGVGTVELESVFMREEGGLLSRPQVGMVEDGTRGSRRTRVR